MRPRWSCQECRIEIQVEPRIQRQAVTRHLNHVDLVITLEVNLAEIVFIQEVVGHHQALVVVSQYNVMWTSTYPKIHEGSNLREGGRICDVEHADLAGLEQAEDQAITRARNGQKLEHSTAHGGLDVGHDVLAI